jgi:hypothetical protein
MSGLRPESGYSSAALRCGQAAAIYSLRKPFANARGLGRGLVAVRGQVRYPLHTESPWVLWTIAAVFVQV